MPQASEVQSMFGRIARRYDRANRVLSGGCDIFWRRRLVSAVRTCGPREVLDLATGSGDVALALARGVPSARRIIGADFCAPMLAVARAKLAANPRLAHLSFVEADALALPFPEASFDAVTLAFGFRNFADRARGLAEIRRVLRPGGRLHILEFSQPRRTIAPGYYFYLRRVLPRLAAALTGDRSAYLYLGDSIAAFPSCEGLCAELQAAGFQAVAAQRLTLGIVALHTAGR